MSGDRGSKSGFTLVELLVVIAIIGILIALLLPAVQAARESGRRITCQNNAKQLSLAMLQHHEVYKFFPSAGWGWHWLGDPDRGTGKKQPGSWCYSILPFLEQPALHAMGTDQQPDVITDPQKVATREATQFAVSAFYCPTRRAVGLYPHVIVAAVPGGHAWNADADVERTNRTDYGANAGDTKVFWGGGPDPANGFAGNGFADMSASNGIVAQRSEVQMAHVRDGASNTYLIGEKYLNPDHYATGLDYSDDHSFLAGDDFDMNKWTDEPPLADRYGQTEFWRFGSSHPGGFNMSLCDGSAHTINFQIDPKVHRLLGNRKDGQAVMLP